MSHQWGPEVTEEFKRRFLLNEIELGEQRLTEGHAEYAAAEKRAKPYRDKERAASRRLADARERLLENRAELRGLLADPDDSTEGKAVK